MNSVLSIGLIFIGLIIGLSNWFAYISASVKKGSTSFVPFIGCILMLVGFFIGPYKQLWSLALVLDFTAIPMLIVAAVDKIKQGK